MGTCRAAGRVVVGRLAKYADS